MKKSQHYFLFLVLVVLAAGCGNNDSEKRLEETLKPFFEADVVIMAVFFNGSSAGKLGTMEGAMDFTPKLDRLAAAAAACELTGKNLKAITSSQMKRIAKAWNHQHTETFKDLKLKFAPKTENDIIWLVKGGASSMDQQEWTRVTSVLDALPEPTRKSILTSVERHGLMRYFVREEKTESTTSTNP